MEPELTMGNSEGSLVVEKFRLEVGIAFDEEHPDVQIIIMEFEGRDGERARIITPRESPLGRLLDTGEISSLLEQLRVDFPLGSLS